MNKKTTAIAAGIAIGASILAGAGYGLYTYLRKKFNRTGDTSATGGSTVANSGFANGFTSDNLVKSNTLYGLGHVENGLIAGGLYKGGQTLY